MNGLRQLKLIFSFTIIAVSLTVLIGTINDYTSYIGVGGANHQAYGPSTQTWQVYNRRSQTTTEQTQSAIVKTTSKTSPLYHDKFKPGSANSTLKPLSLTTTPEKGSGSGDIIPFTISDRLLHNTEQHTNQPPSIGYIITESYKEQLTSASRNLQSLQCWSAKVADSDESMLVVEPQAANSVLHTPFQNTSSTTLKFGDIYDMEAWNRESSRLGHSRLASWESFLRQAPRKVITVQLRDFGVKSSNSSTKWKECPPSKKWPHRSKRAFLKEHKFLIARAVCLQFVRDRYLEMDEFRSLIFGPLLPYEVTVFFEEWRGMGIGNKIPVRNSGCANSGIQERMPLSNKIREDANKYIQHHFNGDYIAIMARVEKSRLSSYRRDLIPHCFEQLTKRYRALTDKLGTNVTFLSTDIGRYGSHTLKSTFKKRTESVGIEEQFKGFFTEIYGNSLSIQQWESSFKDFARSTDIGYIAQLQKQLVARARCVVFMGGGCFQKHALRLYQFSHSTDEQCIDIANECTHNDELPREYINDTQLVITAGTVF